MNESPHHEPPRQDESQRDTPPPRAFAQGTGVVLQTVGMIFVLATCCTCSLTFLWDERPPLAQVQSDPPPASDSIGDAVASLLADPGKSGLMLTIVALQVGGLALAVFGLGMQSEKRRAAWAAVVTLFALSSLLILAGVWLWQGDATMHARTWHALALIVTLSLWLFVIPALRQVIANPPPADVETLPPGYKIPYSMYHDDPPEVRLAQDIAKRRAKLEAERAELERLERDLREKQKDGE